MKSVGAFLAERLPALEPTPLMPVTIDPEVGEIWCKCEFLNPSGSTKDRIAQHIVAKALRSGRLKPGDRVVEASSGSTSIALALVCARLGLGFTAYIPAGATSERSRIIRAYGGEVVRVPGGIGEAIRAAAADCARTGGFAVRQFENSENAEAHRLHTGHEILDTLGSVDAVVSGVGTGGTLLGLWQACESAGCATRAYAAIPVEGGAFGDNAECCSLAFSHGVPGVADGLSALYNEWRRSAGDSAPVEIPVDEAVCLETTRALWRQGFPVGPSSGLNYVAAVEAKRLMGRSARVVTVFADRMERYFSHPVFAGAE